MSNRTIEITFRHKEMFFYLENKKCYPITYPMVPVRKAANV